MGEERTPTPPDKPDQGVTSMYNYQPAYAATLKPENGGRVLVNAALVNRPEFAEVLFKKLTERQELIIHFQPLMYWSMGWVAILLFAFSFIPKWLCGLAVGLIIIKHTGAVHNCAHLKGNMPFLLRMTGQNLFCSGFYPFAGTQGDWEWDHIKRHHVTKGPFDHSQNDHDLDWAALPLWKLLLHHFLLVTPSAGWDVVFFQYFCNPASIWPERIALNLCHWTQLFLLYRLCGANDFWSILVTGHIATFIIGYFFHGIIHRPCWYRFLTEIDPSGERKIPIVDSILYFLFGSIWAEAKWHDVHHTHYHSLLCFVVPKVRGFTFNEIDSACADMADEGLFVDSNGECVSPLAEIGHKVGARKEYLAKNKKD